MDQSVSLNPAAIAGLATWHIDVARSCLLLLHCEKNQRRLLR